MHDQTFLNVFDIGIWSRLESSWTCIEDKRPFLPHFDSKGTAFKGLEAKHTQNTSLPDNQTNKQK